MVYKDTQRAGPVVVMDLKLADRQEERIGAALLREQRRGVRMAAVARLIALTVILLWTLAIDRTYENLPIYGIIGILAGLSFFTVWIASRDLYRTWMLYPLVLVEHALIAYGLLFVSSFAGEPFPGPIMLRSVWFAVFFLFIAGATLAQAPLLVLWSGFCAAAAWCGGALIVMRDPAVRVTDLTFGGAGTMAELLAIYLHPMFVDQVGWMSQALLLMLVSTTLAVAVMRSRRMMTDQIAAERERANLARYFSPDMVDRLASMDSPLAQAQTRSVAVMFADLVGFTRLCEQEPPEAVIDLLRGFRARMERCVFANGGTIDKYVGDCVMVTFGTLQTSPQDAASSLACALDMVQSVETWNREREAEGRPLLRLGIGIHYGEALLGDIGGERQMEFTVIGDTVNVASRLEKITRDLGADIVVSDDLARAAQAAVGEGILRSFQKAEAVSLRGRSGSIGVWYHARVDQLAA